MIDESVGNDDEVDASFYGRSNANNSSSKLMTSVPLGKWFPLRIARHSWWIWCCMCFRFNAIRQLPATESKRYGFWARHHENDTVAFVGVQWGEHIHIESRIRWRWLLKASDRWGESEMEQWGHARDGSAVLSVTKLNAFKLSVKFKISEQNVMQHINVL